MGCRSTRRSPRWFSSSPRKRANTVFISGRRRFFGLGAKDENDSVGNRDSFSEADEAIISRRFGKSPVARWKAATRSYKGLDARFVMYLGGAHQVSAEMNADIERVFEKY